jgi:hypothetical protein
VSRRAIQILFVALGLAWLAFTLFDLVASTAGDCFDNQWCWGRKSIALDLVFWRGLCVALILVIAYRMVRKDADVQ